MPHAQVQEGRGEDGVRHGVLRVELVGGAQGGGVAVVGVQVGEIGDARMIPAAQIPLVEGDFDAVLQPQRAEQAADGGDAPLKLRGRLKGFPVAAQRVGLPRLVEVAVDADHVDQIARAAQQGQVPVDVRHGGGQNPDAGVHAAHHLGALADERPPLLRRLRSDLAAGVVLVADGPVLDAERLLVPVGDAQPGPAAHGRLVAVFHPVGHLLRRAGARVGAQVRRRAELPAQQHELVCAERVALLDAPGLVKRGHSVPADAVLPVIGGDEAAAGPAHHRDAQTPERGDHVAPEAVRVAERVAGVVEAAVDLAAKVLDELPVDHGIDVVQGAPLVDVKRDGHEHSSRMQKAGGRLRRRLNNQPLTAPAVRPLMMCFCMKQ